MARTRRYLAGITLEINHNYETYINDIKRIAAHSGDMTQVVLEGINEIQKWQRRLAPRGKGPGPHGRIPRNIDAARIYKRGDSVTGISRTTYVPAIVTAIGSGKYGPTGQPYPITRGDKTWYHPGVKGTNWWDEGAVKGSSVAIRAFRRKVRDILNLRGRV